MSERWRRFVLPPDWPYEQALSSAVVSVGCNRLIINGGTGFPFGTTVDNTLLELNVDTGVFRTHPCKPKNDDPHNVPQTTYGHVSFPFVI